MTYMKCIFDVLCLWKGKGRTQEDTQGKGGLELRYGRSSKHWKESLWWRHGDRKLLKVSWECPDPEFIRFGQCPRRRDMILQRATDNKHSHAVLAVWKGCPHTLPWNYISLKSSSAIRGIWLSKRQGTWLCCETRGSNKKQWKQVVVVELGPAIGRIALFPRSNNAFPNLPPF